MQKPGETSARNSLTASACLMRHAPGARSHARRRCRGCSRTAPGRSCPGADAPKCSIEIESPWSPTHLLQPSSTPGSTESRARTSGGSTSSRYSAGCSSKSSQHGIETTRTAVPSAAILRPASSVSPTSAPVAIRIRSGEADDSHSVYAPRSRPEAGRELAAVERRHLLARERQRDRPVGPLERDLPRVRRSRSRRPGARTRGSGSHAARRRSRPADASGRPRRGRPSRASTPRRPAAPSAPTGARPGACSR